ncbi:hypothetical protein VPNG_06252 [Cytospora leucostoma]|uniref:Uncharacterized protein n=1 Tax=Cytospora leucostoma TaxID=1230097 RepID=A0A423WYG6_9PEZI|nr:hypothetical protein VPNG_06252 [Cytospora leucostoma]
MEFEKGQSALLSPAPPSSASVLDPISPSGHNVMTPHPVPGPSATPPHTHPPSSLPLAQAVDHELSPRNEFLELIPEDRSLDTLHAGSDFASPSTKSLARPTSPSTTTTLPQSTSHRTSGPSTPEAGIIRPAVRRPPLHSLPSRASSRSPTSPFSPIEAPLSPAIVRTASTHSVLRHPTPDTTINARSGSYTSNIAALEATAERFSMTSSIEDAIRHAHEELKRTDSRRSSILAASVRSGGDFPGIDSPPGIAPAPLFARKTSIVGLNNEARSGGYSPGGFIMSPAQSLTERLTSGSKSSGALSRANSTKSKAETIEGEAFPNLSALSMSRSGPGKTSVHSARSTRSGALSLAEIAEMEPPSTLTQAAMDEADHGLTKLQDLGQDDDTLLSRARQHVEPDATDTQVTEDITARASEDWARTPMLDHSAASYWDNHAEPDIQLRVPQNPPSARIRDEYEHPVEQRQGTMSSPDTDEDDHVFADFDGMHCDPDTVAEHFPILPDEAEYPHTRHRELDMPTTRSQSYFDPATGRNMLYYPARVPAMLNLPPKLGKGVKSAQRNVRRSQVLNQMPPTAQENRTWLPDPLEGESFLDLMGDGLRASSVHSVVRGEGPDHAFSALEGPGPILHLVNPSSAHSQDAPELEAPRRPGMANAYEQRKSRLNVADLPPQLRASVFFDLPTEAPKIEVKDGSATKTLDSILDAAASAPVTAFTDHAFAGHLGAEVYGHDKKKNRKSKILTAEGAELGSPRKPNKLVKSTASTPTVPEGEKRKSVWSLLPGRKSRSSINLLAEREGDARSRLSGSAHNASDSGSEADEHSALAPDDVERGSELGSGNEEQVFSGPPTTLLAELQMRKQRQRERTRNPQRSTSELHSTLLELDAVAQIEAQARRSKHISLAWTANPDQAASDDDEDVPLGLLAAKKQMGPDATDRGLAIAAQELSRPLGLLEQREKEDNEPLSRRRDRLQGKEAPVSMYLQPGGNDTRLSRIGGANGQLSPRLLRSISPAASHNGSTASQSKPEEEFDGETLGERMRRLRAKGEGDNPLPRARPVSTAFSTEMMSELGINGEDEKDKDRAVDKGKGKENEAPQAEEEETLGQRRRRLQAEREAREEEMGIRAVSGESPGPGLKSRLSMADVLGANPLEGPQGRMDPREAARLRKEEEAARAGREQAAKMAAFRAQIPQQLHEPGAGVMRAGGFQGGKFNDSTGGLGLGTGQSQGHNLRGSMSMGQLGQFHPQQLSKGMGGVNTWNSGGATNLVGAAGSYNNAQAGPDGSNPAFSKGNAFGRGYGGGLLQQANQQQGPFVSGSLLANGGGYGVFGGGIGAAGGYAHNQTAYGAGVGFNGGMAPGYAMQAGVPRQAEHVERWRQGIR